MCTIKLLTYIWQLFNIDTFVCTVYFTLSCSLSASDISTTSDLSVSRSTSDSARSFFFGSSDRRGSRSSVSYKKNQGTYFSTAFCTLFNNWIRVFKCTPDWLTKFNKLYYWLWKDKIIGDRVNWTPTICYCFRNTPLTIISRLGYYYGRQHVRTTQKINRCALSLTVTWVVYALRIAAVNVRFGEMP